MEFKDFKPREIVLTSIAALMVATVFVFHMTSDKTQTSKNMVETSALPTSTSFQPTLSTPVVSARSIADFSAGDEDTQGQREMKEQMQRDRKQQRQIKMLKMQFEEINLQLENEKAQTEINKLKRENAGYIKDSGSPEATGFPVIKIIYIGGGDAEKEAILSIDGTSYSVKPKDRPTSSVEIVNITDKGIQVHFSNPHELTSMINYVQE